MIKNKTVQFFLKSAAAFLILLMLHRALFLTLFSQVKHSISEYTVTFLTGLRFDLMIIGFIFFPAIIFYWIIFLTKIKIEKKLAKSIGIYFQCAAILVLVITILDFLSFEKSHDRLNAIYMELGLWLQIPYSTKSVIIIILLSLIALIGNRLLEKIRQTIVVEKIAAKELLLITFLAALLARGSIGSRHIDLGFSQVTESEFLNLTTLNSAYALDQALRQRR